MSWLIWGILIVLLVAYVFDQAKAFQRFTYLAGVFPRSLQRALMTAFPDDAQEFTEARCRLVWRHFEDTAKDLTHEKDLGKALTSLEDATDEVKERFDAITTKQAISVFPKAFRDKLYADPAKKRAFVECLDAAASVTDAEIG